MSVFLLLVFLYRDFLTLPVSTHYPPFFNVFQFFRQNNRANKNSPTKNLFTLYIIGIE